MPKVSSGISYSKNYTEEDMQRAIAAVNNGMPKKTAAKKFGVPRPTLQFRFSSQYVKSRPGPPTNLTDEEEKTLVNWIISCSQKGFPKRKEDVLLSVEQFLNKTPRPNNFNNNKPGDGWYRLFLNRHPEITSRTAEAVTSASANVSEANIRQWFYQIEDILKDSGHFEILKDPSRVFNGDETNFQLCPKNSMVLAAKGTKNVYEVDHAVAKTCITVMFTFSASGDTTPPMVIYPSKRMRANISSSIPSHWGLGLSDNGWMNTELFYQYIHNILYPYLIEKKVQLPIILFLDGHKSHMNYDLSESCKQKGIILIALYPNSTRILQPADVAAFRPMKVAWRKAVLDWRRKNLAKTLTKVDFGPIISTALEKHMKPSTVTNGFRACGLCPWNPNAIDFSKCLGKNTSRANASTSSDQPPNPPTRPTMNLAKFQEIVGPSIVDTLLQQNSADKIGSEPYYEALLKVHSYLIGIQNHDDKETATCNSLRIDNDWVDIDDIPIVISEPTETFSDTNDSDNILMQQNNDDFIVHNFEPEAPLQTAFTTKSIVSADETLFTPLVTNLTGSKENNVHQDSRKEASPCQEVPPTACSEQTPVKNTLNDSLLWPKTPVRKGKIIRDKPVFVLTSKEWLEKEKFKLDEKERKENEKQERKRQREENKSKNKDKPKKKKTAEKTEKKKKTDKSSIRETQNCEEIPVKYPKNIDLTTQTQNITESKVNNPNFEQKKHEQRNPNILSEIKLAQPKPEMKNVILTNEGNIKFNYTVISPKDFVLSRPRQKILERRETFRNEEELTDFLNDCKDSQD